MARSAPDLQCRACGSTGGRVRYRSGTWAVVKCAACGLLSTWPEPDDETLTAMYASPDYFRDRSMGTTPPDEGRDRAQHILSLLQPDGPVLDFGAGNGYLVRGMRSLGIEADGVEPSPAARAIASDLHGVDLLHALPAGDGHYSGVTMLHVAEHLRDPVAELRRLGDALTPGGKLFLEVPHAGSVRLLPPARRADVLDLPAHLHHFTPKTLADVLARAGYEVVAVWLFNAWLLERLLARPAAAPAPSGTEDEQPVTAASAEKYPVARAVWRSALARLRVVAPGEKFQIVARRRAVGGRRPSLVP